MRMTIKAKLGLAFATIIILSGITAYLGIDNLASVNASLDRVVRGPTQRVIQSQELNEELLEIVRAEKNLNLSETKEQAADFTAELGKLRPGFITKLERLEASASVEGKPLWSSALNQSRQYLVAQDKIIDAINRRCEGPGAGNFDGTDTAGCRRCPRGVAEGRRPQSPSPHRSRGRGRTRI